MKPLNRFQHPLFSSHYAINTTNTEGMSPLANLNLLCSNKLLTLEEATPTSHPCNGKTMKYQQK